jgi:aerotaxis receptor
MRTNQPVTDREVEVKEGQVLVSRTDPDSRIVFANNAFVDISGFTSAELLGQPHNIVRHPDMPAEAFENLWTTVKAGRPWNGLVKNRARNGDFYWVRANVTPVVEEGAVAGYISIRSRPSRDDVAQAEAAYAAMRAGRPTMRLADGELQPNGLAARLARARDSISVRLALCFALMIAMVLAVGGIALSGMADSNQALHSVYADRTVPAGQIATINDLMHTNAALARDMAGDLEVGAADTARDRARAIRANRDRITAIWTEYMQTFLTEEEKGLAAAYAAKRAAFVKGGLEAAIALADRGDAQALNTHIRTTLVPLFQEARTAALALLDLQSRVANELNDEAEANFVFHFRLAAALVAAATLASVLFGLWMLATIRRPLREMNTHFNAIAQGNTQHEIAMPAAREFHAITRMLRSMRARLSYASEERIQRERDAARERRRTVQDMAETVEAETKLAVDRIAAQTGRMAAEAREMTNSASRVSTNATSVAAAAEEALANAQAVGAASEELTASINEIAAQVSQASAVAARAVEGGERAQDRIRTLSESATRIGDVVQLISSIAGQTNLLALNATIEAARAGDAGKGFAVVASEVKSLATQTARSTEEISRQIAEIQATTGAVVEVVGDIGARIQELAQVSVAVAAAVEQQASATQEIARNVTQTGAAAQEVAQRISEVSADAGKTGDQAALVQSGSDDISRTIETLGGSIVQMIRTATRDADRRQQKRHLVDSAATLTGPDGKRHEGRLHDISRGGALIQDIPGISPGQRVSLVALGLGSDCRADCHVAERLHDGALRLLLIEGSESPALVAALDRLDGSARLSA